jgi:hypothetical protein
MARGMDAGPYRPGALDGKEERRPQWWRLDVQLMGPAGQAKVSVSLGRDDGVIDGNYGQKKEVPVKNTIIVVCALLIVVFLAGFLPQYAKVKRLENELHQARQENSLAEVRDLAGMAYFQATQKDYGLAASTSTRFFDRTRQVANQMPDSSGRKPLEDLLSFRDKVTAKLAQGDPGVLSDLQTLFVKTRQATAISAGVQKPE